MIAKHTGMLTSVWGLGMRQTQGGGCPGGVRSTITGFSSRPSPQAQPSAPSVAQLPTQQRGCWCPAALCCLRGMQRYGSRAVSTDNVLEVFYVLARDYSAKGRSTLCDISTSAGGLRERRAAGGRGDCAAGAAPQPQAHCVQRPHQWLRGRAEGASLEFSILKFQFTGCNVCCRHVPIHLLWGRQRHTSAAQRRSETGVPPCPKAAM